MDDDNKTNSESFSDYTPDTDGQYVEDNGYSQDVIDDESAGIYQPPAVGGAGGIMKGFGSGLKEGLKGKPNPTINDIPRNKNKNKEDPKSNPALGQKKDKNNQNNNEDNKKDKKEMPKANKNDNNQNAKTGNDRNNKQKESDKKSLLNRKNKEGSPLSKLGGPKGNKGGVKEKAGDAIKDAAKQGAKAVWTALPLPAKIAVVAIGLGIILALFLFALVSLIATGTTVGAAMCSQSDYDVSGADAGEFLGSMQNPFGDSGYSVTSIYGWRICPVHGPEFHTGIDLVGKTKAIYAVQDGKVETSGNCGGYGNCIIINHSDTYYTRYAHLSSFAAGIKVGATVKAGERIGTEGSTGDSTGSHLHFELMDKTKNTLSVNPYFGYSDKGYEKCLDKTSNQGASKCDLDHTGNARKTGADGLNQILQKTNDYTSGGSCCSTYDSSVNGQPIAGMPKILTTEFVDGAIQSQSKYGVPASLTLAQIVQESSGSYPGGVSGLAYNCKNLFGIKGTGTIGSCKYSTGEQTASGSSYTIVAGFRKYKTYAESIEDHAKLLTGKIYTPCTSSAKNADDWAKAIKKCGYATDVNYANNLINVMKKYNLYQYDDASVFGTGSGDCSESTGSTDIVERANQELEKWKKVTSSERSEMVKNYMEACGLGRTCNEWCAGFVSYILKETGKLQNLKGYSCMANSYKKVTPAEHHKARSSYIPKPGDIVYFAHGHVAIVEYVEGKTLHYIGGNQSGTPTPSCLHNAITKNTINLDNGDLSNYATIK